MDIEQLFQSLAEDDIDRFISTQQEESLFLEFKCVTKSDLSHGDDKKNLARALSGFANSSGGLVVWGVDARKNERDVDCATDKKVIPNVAQFVSRLNDLTGSFVTPIVAGIRHRRISADESGAGLAVTIIPESESGPHMAKGGEDRYFKRSGDSFYRMEHFDLEDMFGRRKKPRLDLHIRIIQRGGSSGGGITEHGGHLVIGIENSGRALARAPFLELEIDGDYRISDFGLTGNGREGLPRLAHAGPTNKVKFGGGYDTVIHPHVLLEVSSIKLSAVARANGSLEMPPPLAFSFLVTADGVTAQSGRRELSSDDIASALFPSQLYVSKSEREGAGSTAT
jgi:hypothetical protein